MKTRILLSLLLGFVACGGGGGTDAGSGTKTLLVQAQVAWNAELQGAEIHVAVERAGANVEGANVVVHSDLGDVTLTLDHGNLGGGGDYVGVQAGWAGSYGLEVSAGDDHLSAAISAPEQMTLTAPDTATAIDAHQAANGIVTLRWSGSAADSIRVRSKDFDYTGADQGHVDMPATLLKDSSQELSLRRENSVALAGGVAGSTLSATCRSDFTLIVVNPY